MNKKCQRCCLYGAAVLITLCLAIFSLFTHKEVLAAGRDLSQQISEIKVKNLDHPQENEDHLFCDGDRLQLTFVLPTDQEKIGQGDYLDLNFKIHQPSPNQTSMGLLPFHEKGQLFCQQKLIGSFELKQQQCHISFTQDLPSSKQGSSTHFSFVFLVHNLSAQNTAVDIGNRTVSAQFYLQKNNLGKSTFVVRKSGLISGNHIFWTAFINLNECKADADGQYQIVEEIDDQQDFVPASLTLSSTRSKEEKLDLDKCLKTKGRQLELALPHEQVAGQVLKLSYQTRVNEQSKDKPHSTTKIGAQPEETAFKEEAEPPVQFKQNNRLLMINSWLMTASGQKLPLAAQKFTISSLANNEDFTPREVFTDENGQIEISDLPQGRYLVKPETYSEQIELAQPQTISLDAEHPQSFVQFWHHLKENNKDQTNDKAKKKQQLQAKALTEALGKNLLPTDSTVTAQTGQEAVKGKTTSAQPRTMQIKQLKEPKEDKQENSEAESTKFANEGKKRSSHQRAACLPQTGTQNNGLLLLIGGLLFALNIAVVLALKQKKNAD